MQLHQEVEGNLMRMHQTGARRATAMIVIAVAAALAYALVLAGCDGKSAATSCRGDQDCPSGLCIDGQCRPLLDLGQGPADGGGGDDAKAPASDLSTPIPDGWSPDALAAACSFNNDGVIERSEAPFLVGLGALFAANASGSTVTVNLTPVNGVWDFSAAVPSERKVFDQLVSPSGTWWAGDFPGATYAERLDDSQPLYGVYKATPTSLELLGVVSEQNGAQKTELTYATPIDVLKFPLSQGMTWSSESNVSGLANGVAVAEHDKYVFTVDARGTTKAPAGSFDTLRLRFDYTQTIGFYTNSHITYLHLAECYGAVARVRSQDAETNADFTQAAEYRRLATQ